ncbi:ribonuclease Oy-like isoform X1 [Rhodnius prolixus]|uniref:ribonuclease Oy-like isoform X1 n=1 Tax=Rhodnius prolixus TaxID=13249 RepID=UPI003D18C5F2
MLRELDVSLNMPPQRRYISPTTVIIAGALFIFSSCGLTNSFYRLIRTRQSNEFDVLIFTQNWPVSVCLSWEAKQKTNTCSPGVNISSWTIHGIWPTKLGTLGPFFCNTSRPFDPDAIYGIQDRLEKQWSLIEKHKKHNMFWRHEWEKHGTCAAQLPQLSTEFTYFLQGLNWNSEYNVTTMLQESDIVPGKTYNISTIWSAVKKSIGKNPHLACFNDPVSKSSYLLEVRICFNKSLELVDCDGTKFENKWYFRRSQSLADANYTDCSLDTLVEYPLFIQQPPPTPTPIRPKQHFLIDMLKLIQLLAWATS